MNTYRRAFERNWTPQSYRDCFSAIVGDIIEATKFKAHSAALHRHRLSGTTGGLCWNHCGRPIVSVFCKRVASLLLWCCFNRFLLLSEIAARAFLPLQLPSRYETFDKEAVFYILGWSCVCQQRFEQFLSMFALLFNLCLRLHFQGSCVMLFFFAQTFNTFMMFFA